MDLGFGESNQKVGSTAESIILRTTKAQEQAVQDEISRYDAMLNDDEALELLRARRIQEMKKEREERFKWKEAGHGSYDEIGQGQDARDVGREFFEATPFSINHARYRKRM